MKNEIRILAVDDDKDMLCLLEGILGSEGCKVITANSAPEFMKVADEQIEPPDLVITDMDMNAMTGFGVIHQARTRWGKGIPVIIMSGGLRDNPEKLRKCLRETGYVVHKGPDFNIVKFKEVVEAAVLMSNRRQEQAVAA